MPILRLPIYLVQRYALFNGLMCSRGDQLSSFVIKIPIAARLASQIVLILSEINEPNSTVFWSVWFNGTKVPLKLHLSVGHREIIGSVSQCEMIETSEESDKSVKSILSDNSIEGAKEAKVEVVSIKIRAIGCILICLGCSATVTQ